MRIAVGLAALGALAWWLVLDPLRADVDARVGQLAQAEADLARLAPLSAAVAAAERDADRLEQALADVQLPPEEPFDASAVLARLHEAAAGADLRLVSVRPRAPSNGGIGERPAGPDRMSFDVSVSGSFAAVYRFLADLAASPVVVTTPDLKLSRSPGLDSDGHVLASLVVVAHAITPRGRLVAALNDEAAEDVASDPFQGPGVPPAARHAEAPRRAGLAGVPVSSVTVKGVARRGSVGLAILETADRQSFVVRARDRLADGVVERVDAAGVVFAQTGADSGTALVRKAVARERGPQ